MEPVPFNLTVDSGSFGLGASSEEYMRSRLDKLERWTRKFPHRDCHLSIQYSERDTMHKVVLSLRLPNLTLAGRAEERHLRSAFDRALKRVLRQLNEFKHVLRREHLHRRVRERRMAAGAYDEDELRSSAGARDLERFRAGLGSHLGALKSFVSAELCELRQRGRTVSAEAEEGLLDGILREAIDRFDEKSTSMASRSWLYHVAVGAIDRLVPRNESRPTPTPSAHDHGAWQLFFDAHGDSVSLPGPAQAEVRAVVDEKLSILPRDWRRAFRLHYLDGLDVVEISELLDLEQDQVMFRLRGASEFLRDHLEDLHGTVPFGHDPDSTSS